MLFAGGLAWNWVLYVVAGWAAGVLRGYGGFLEVEGWNCDLEEEEWNVLSEWPDALRHSRSNTVVIEPDEQSLGLIHQDIEQLIVPRLHLDRTSSVNARTL